MMIGNAAGNDCAECKTLNSSFHRLNLYTNVTIPNVYSSGLTVLNMLCLWVIRETVIPP